MKNLFIYTTSCRTNDAKIRISKKRNKKNLLFSKKVVLLHPKFCRDVAQLASAPRSGRGGRTFKSSHPDFFCIRY